MSILVLLALATLVSEDLTCIAAGALVASGQLALFPATAACFAGILLGDLLLYGSGRLAGPQLLRWSFVQRFVMPAEVERAACWLDRRGLADADGGAAIRQPVFPRIAAIAAAGDLVHHVAGAARGIGAAKREIARGAGGCGSA